MATKKTRLDKLLVDLGYFDSREKAQTCIMMNGVKIAGTLQNKPGYQINEDHFHQTLKSNPKYIEVNDKMPLYVSRGAFKLKAAYENFGLDFTGMTLLDIGASTGGFTDFALSKGARQVLALDVGRGQLAFKLQEDKRVVNLQGINFREFNPEEWIEEKYLVNFVTIDVSFISSILILEKLKEMIKNPSLIKINVPLDIVLLIKPQFEAGKEIVDKCEGVIKDPSTRQEILLRTIDKIREVGFEMREYVESPILGAKGNVEYVALLRFYQ